MRIFFKKFLLIPTVSSICVILYVSTDKAATARRLKFATGGKQDMQDEELDTKAFDRLADWLKAQGFSAEKVLECFKYIADESAPSKR